MKKSISIISLLTIFIMPFAYGQTLTGDRLIGGNASFVFNDNINISISPNMGWFLKDQFALGGYLSYTYSHYSSSNNNGLSLGPFARYYFSPEGELRFFSYAGIGYTYNHNKYDESTETYNSLRCSIGIGAAYFITSQVALEAQAGYYARNIAADLDTDQGFYLTFGLQIHLLKQE